MESWMQGQWTWRATVTQQHSTSLFAFCLHRWEITSRELVMHGKQLGDWSPSLWFSALRSDYTHHVTHPYCYWNQYIPCMGHPTIGHLHASVQSMSPNMICSPLPFPTLCYLMSKRPLNCYWCSRDHSFKEKWPFPPGNHHLPIASKWGVEAHKPLTPPC